MRAQRRMKTSTAAHTLRLKHIVAAVLALSTAQTARAESATMGWQAVSTTGFYVSQVQMVGPTARNKRPEKRGEFKGEFLGVESWQPKLIGIYKLWLGRDGELQSKKIEFTITPVSTPEKPVVNGIKFLKTKFETQAL